MSSMPRQLERRGVSTAQVNETSNGHTVTGRGVTYNSWSEDLGFFERFLPGSLALDRNLSLLYNHDTSNLLATTRGNTLSTTDKKDGLYYSASLPATTLGNDTAILMQRGDIGTQTSFGFYVNDTDANGDPGDNWEQHNGVIYRTIRSATLLEISILGGTTAAYQSNYADLRNASADIRERVLRDNGNTYNDDSNNPDDDNKTTDECRCECDGCTDADDDAETHDCIADERCALYDNEDDTMRSLLLHSLVTRRRLSLL